MNIKLIDYGYENAPKRAHFNDAGADVFANETVYISKGDTRKIKLGFGLELPDGFMGLVLPRSSFASKGIVAEIPPIDSGYTGEIHAIVTNHSHNTARISKGTRIAQLVIIPMVIANFVENAGESRGNNGFGSTGN